MSILKVNTIQNASGGNASTTDNIQQGIAKAWVNFDGTFGTSPFTIGNGGIRNSFNVSSVTDNGTGDYTVTFTTAMANANYAVALSVKIGNSDLIATGSREMIRQTTSGGYTTAECRICCSSLTQQIGVDPTIFNCTVFGD